MFTSRIVDSLTTDVFVHSSLPYGVGEKISFLFCLTQALLQDQSKTYLFISFSNLYSSYDYSLSS